MGDEGGMMTWVEWLLSLYPAETGIKFDFAVQLLDANEPDRAESLLVGPKIDPQDQLRWIDLRPAHDEGPARSVRRL